ncbi:MAG: hypothetical protein WBE26_00035 [Phycisphaerae bacterium]
MSMGKVVLGVVGLFVIGVTLTATLVTAAEQPNRAQPRLDPVPVEDTFDLATYCGPGAVSVTSDGEWILELDGLEEPIVFDATIKKGNLLPNSSAVGHVDVTLDRTTMWVMVTDDKDAEYFYQAIVKVDEHDVKEIAKAISAADIGLREDPVEPQCPGGSCSCAGKCTACCPIGFFPDCNCNGSGRCTCRPKSS